MADDPEREAFFNLIKSVAESARGVFLSLIRPYMEAKFDEALSPGGEAYDTILAGAIQSADDWYGLYTPEVYERGMTLSDPDNIEIQHSDIQTEGTVMKAKMSVSNVAPHAIYEAGFLFMKRGHLMYRPGGDLTAQIKPVHLHFEIPEQLADQYYEQALSVVFG